MNAKTDLNDLCRMRQSEVARKIGISDSYLSQLLRGRRRIRVAEAIKISNLLQMPIADVLRAFVEAECEVKGLPVPEIR